MRWISLKRCDRCSQDQKHVKRKLYPQSDEDYGVNDRPDMEPETYSEKVEEFLSELDLSAEEREGVEKETRGQSGNFQWKEQ